MSAVFRVVMRCVRGFFGDARKRVRNNQIWKLRYHEDVEFREEVLKANRERHAANKDEINAGRRMRYATDEDFHEKRLAAGRAVNWRILYGLSPRDVAAMLARQNGVCGICKNKRKKKVKRLVVDHCHDTSGVRGLLCDSCNFGLGKFEDNPEFLRAAADWIEDYRKRIAGTLT
jgi:hypothetical protein